MYLIEILFFLFVGVMLLFVVGVKNGFLEHLDFYDSDSTECPNCSNKIPPLPFGKHRCRKCDFVYDVNRLGYAKTYSKERGVWAKRISNFLFLIAAISFVTMIYPKPEDMGEVGLGSFDFFVYMFVALIVALKLKSYVNSNKEGRESYENQKNQETG